MQGGGASSTGGSQANTTASTSARTFAQAPSGGGITADLFRHALQASGVTIQQEGSQQRQQPVVTEAGLQQLRDMGIMDETVARRALEASGGDIQGALELIFGEGDL